MEHDRNWHYMSAEEVEQVFDTGSVGLSDEEAQARCRSRRNRIWQIRGDLVGGYAKRSLLDPSAVLLLLSVIVAAFYGEGAVAACVLILMLFAKMLEIFAFTVADSEFRKNMEASVPRAKVVREGNVKSIPCELIAEGDIIVLDAGDTVPCDIRLIAADSVLVSENLPGGQCGLYIKNADPISRHVEDVPIEMRSNMLYATTTVVYGFGIGVAVATGKRTLRVSRDGPVELSGNKAVSLLEKLSELSRMCRLWMVAAAFLIIIFSLFFKVGLIGAFLPAVAMASACMSEFLAAYGAFAIAMSLRGHRKKDTGAAENTVFKVASRIEDAAHSNVIALRSPALLKCGKISLHSFYIGGKKIDAEEESPDVGALPMYACYAAGIGYDGNGGDDFNLLPAAYLKKLCKQYASERPAYMISAHKGADEPESEGLDSSLLLRDNEFVFVTVGDPESVLSKCSRYLVENEEKTLSKDEREKTLAYARRLMKQGVKICAVAKRPSVYNSLRRLPVLLSDLCFQGFIAVSEKPEAGAAEMINNYRKAGGSVVIFCENGDEDVLFAESCDVFKVGDIRMNEKEAADAKSLPLEKGSLVMIACPAGAAGTERRFKFLEILANDKRTTYIGCGAEDAICMQRASVSIAVENPIKPGSGIPQSLRTIADGTVESRGGGFVGAYRIMSRFRGVLMSVKSTLQYLICSQVARAFMLLICMVIGISMPSASQMVFIGLVFDLLCALAAALLDRGEDDNIYASAFPRTAPEFIIPAVCGTIIAGLSVAAPYICAMVMNASGRSFSLSDTAMSGCIYASVIIALCVVYADMTSTNGLFARETRIGRAKVIPILIALLSLVLPFLIPSVGMAMGISFPGFISLAFSLIAMLAATVFLAVVRAYYKKTKEK